MIIRSSLIILFVCIIGFLTVIAFANGTLAFLIHRRDIFIMPKSIISKVMHLTQRL